MSSGENWEKRDVPFTKAHEEFEVTLKKARDNLDALAIYTGTQYKSLEAKLAIAVVLNLQPDYADIWQEMYDAKQVHIVVHAMPLCPVLPPSRKAVGYIIDVLSSLSILPPAFSKVLLHCKKGVDRTGYIVAAYRVLVQKWTVDDACKEWKEKGRSWWLGWWEIKFKWDFASKDLGG